MKNVPSFMFKFPAFTHCTYYILVCGQFNCGHVVSRVKEIVPPKDAIKLLPFFHLQTKAKNLLTKEDLSAQE